MKKTSLDILIEGNEFPIVFLGSGISKRYLENYPRWIELLRELWEKYNNNNFFGYLNILRQDITQNGQINDSQLNFLLNTKTASHLEKIINAAFYSNKLAIDDFSQENAFKYNISPFKKILSNRFIKYSIKESYTQEFEEFKKMLMKAQIILTTNYDTFIEDSYNNISTYKIQKYIGQKGFFENTFGYSELYKLHGCATDPNSIIITSNDYEKFDKNSVLISSKIISMLLYSPIIFIGYSLSDINVRNIIKNFVDSLTSSELLILEKRLLLIEWKEGEEDIIEEIITDNDIGCRITVLKTDNFMEIYKKITTINQGVAPSEVRKFQHVIKELIVTRGKEGALNSLLVSPDQLDNIEKIIGNKNVVVAIGDNKIIFALPNILTYLEDYIIENFDQNIDVILRYIANQNQRARLPFIKYLTEKNIDESSITPFEKERLRDRIKIFSNIDHQIRLIPATYRETFYSLKDILNQGYNEEREFNVISYNIKNIDNEILKKYLLEKLKNMKEKGEHIVSTAFRRLTLLYDLSINNK